MARGVVTFFPPIALAFWRWSLAFLFILPFTWLAVAADWPRIMKTGSMRMDPKAMWELETQTGTRRLSTWPFWGTREP